MTTEPTITRKISVIPTTVRIESTENSRFRVTITKSTWANRSASFTWASTPLDLRRSSLTPFQSRNSPPSMRTSDLPLKTPSIRNQEAIWWSTEKSTPVA